MTPKRGCHIITPMFPQPKAETPAEPKRGMWVQFAKCVPHQQLTA